DATQPAAINAVTIIEKTSTARPFTIACASWPTILIAPPSRTPGKRGCAPDFERAWRALRGSPLAITAASVLGHGDSSCNTVFFGHAAKDERRKQAEQRLDSRADELANLIRTLPPG